FGGRAGAEISVRAAEPDAAGEILQALVARAAMNAGLVGRHAFGERGHFALKARRFGIGDVVGEHALAILVHQHSGGGLIQALDHWPLFVCPLSIASCALLSAPVPAARRAASSRMSRPSAGMSIAAATRASQSRAASVSRRGWRQSVACIPALRLFCGALWRH